MTALTGYYDVSTYSSIQMAQNACEDGGGGVLYFPPGEYDLTGTVNVGSRHPDKPVQWRGTGAGSAIIKGTATGLQPTMVETASGYSYFSISDIAFVGNGVDPSPLTTAPPVIVVNGGSYFKAINCYFNANTGTTIDLVDVNDAEIFGCVFYAVGYFSNIADPTPAIFIENGESENSTDVRIHNNSFITCRFGGVRVLGDQCDVSHNAFQSIYGSAIYFSGYDTRVAFNSISTTKAIGTTPSAGIIASAADTFCILGNNISDGDGDGVGVFSGWANGILIGNNCKSNGQAGSSAVGQAGLHVEPHQSGGTPSNEGLIIVGNNLFDSQSTPTQLVGLAFDTSQSPTPAALNSVIGANATYGNASSTWGIDATGGILSDDSNATFGNTGNLTTGSMLGWIDRVHSSAPVSTTSPGTKYTLQSLPVGAGSMLSRAGIRITAGGTCGITGGDTIYLDFGSSEVSISIGSLGSGTTTPWLLTAEVINNDDDPTTQVISGSLTANTTVVSTFRQSASQDSRNQLVISLAAKAATGHTVTCDFMFLERC